ncbi:DUF2188 domain-containing protein [Bradyrhizobium sp. CCBAU 11357]|uniref:DUF2188 domain-containing protein n=1 Tax=Bradyrhizobium sp. CCBAU 11357 TaxID=1630808 RepID=UPI003FA43F81
MARIQHIVTLHNDEWRVFVNGKHSAPYATQKEAIRAAVDTAHVDGKAGHDAQVLVQAKTTNLESSGHMATTHTHQPANRGRHMGSAPTNPGRLPCSSSPRYLVVPFGSSASQRAEVASLAEGDG